jgi:hypothetical protein
MYDVHIYNGDRRLIQSSEEEEAYTRYAQSISKNCATALLSALPRELRDKDYSYVWDNETIVFQTKESIREKTTSYGFGDACPPSYVQQDHVGQIMAEKLALSVYRRAFGTKLEATVSAGHIHKFLAANPLKSTLKPVDCIRALTIEWFPKEYDPGADVARSYRELAEYNFPEPIFAKLILGKFTGDVVGSPAISHALAEKISIFRPAYTALVEKNCSVTIETLNGEMLSPELVV